MWKPDLCIYHGNCDDGFGAAWSVWRRWPEVEFFAAAYGAPPITVDQVRGKHVIMVDFSYPYDVLTTLSWETPRMVILDHHKTAQAALDRLPKMHRCTWRAMDEAVTECWMHNMPEIVTHFDMNKSGARLAWEFCHPGEEIPALIQAVEDRDLWRFAIRDTPEISAALRTYKHDLAKWDEFAADLGPLRRDGEAILRGHRKNIESMCENAYEMEIGGHRVPVVNVPYHYASDIANELLSKFPQAPFAAAWFQRSEGQKQFSLRSEDSRMDVSEIAKAYGGGGHRNAAGFQVTA